MYDTLTLPELYKLHNDLFNEHQALHRKLVGPDYKPIVDPLGEYWAEIDAQCREVSAKMADVHAVIRIHEARRDADQADAASRLLADLRIQRGIDA